MPKNYWDQFETYEEPATNYWDQYEEESKEEDSGWGDFGEGYGLPSFYDIGLTALKAPYEAQKGLMGLGDLITTPMRTLSEKIGGYLGYDEPIPGIRESVENLGYNPNNVLERLSAFDSPEVKAARQEVEQAKGWGETAKSLWRNPGLLGLDIEASAPSIALGGALGAGAKTLGAASRFAGPIGEGLLTAGQHAGQIYDEMGDFELKDVPYTIASGLATGLISAGGNKVARALGLPDIDEMLANGDLAGIRRVKALLGGGTIEGLLEEAPQSASEQAISNLATGKPWSEGVPGAAISGGLTGFALGSAGPAVGRASQPPVTGDYTQQELPFGPPEPTQQTLIQHPIDRYHELMEKYSGDALLSNEDMQELIQLEKQLGVDKQVTKPIYPGINPATGKFRKIYPQANVQGQLPLEPPADTSGQFELDLRSPEGAGGPRAKPAPILRNPLEAIGDTEGSADFMQVWDTLKQLLGRDPSVAEIEAEMAKQDNAALQFTPQQGGELPPGTPTGAVAPFVDPIVRQFRERFPGITDEQIAGIRDLQAQIQAARAQTPIDWRTVNNLEGELGRRFQEALPPHPADNEPLEILSDEELGIPPRPNNMNMTPPSAVPPPMNQPGPSGLTLAPEPIRPKPKPRFPPVLQQPFEPPIEGPTQPGLPIGPRPIPSEVPPSDTFDEATAREIVDRAFPPPGPEQPSMIPEFMDEEMRQWWREQDRIIGENQAERGPLMGPTGPITDIPSESDEESEDVDSPGRVLANEAIQDVRARDAAIEELIRRNLGTPRIEAPTPDEDFMNQVMGSGIAYANKPRENQPNLPFNPAELQKYMEAMAPVERDSSKALVKHRTRTVDEIGDWEWGGDDYLKQKGLVPQNIVEGEMFPRPPADTGESKGMRKYTPVRKGVEDDYTRAKRELEEAYQRGEVVDLEEEMQNLDEMYGVMEGVSTEQQRHLDEVREALDTGHVVYPLGYEGELHGPVVRTLSDGSRVVKTGRGDDTSGLLTEVSKPKGPDEIRMEIGDRVSILRNMQGQYADNGARVATKELLQNALDETPTGGDIEITLDYHAPVPTITVKDNGPGIPLDVLKNEYVTLTGSGKRGVAQHHTGRKTIGEMGVGKATYLLGADKFKIVTRAKETDGKIWEYTVEGTPDQMIGEDRAGNPVPPVKISKSPAAGLATGTEVTIYDSSKDNLDKAAEYLETFGKYSDSPANVKITGNRYKGVGMQNWNLNLTVTPRTSAVGKHVHSGSAPGGDYTIYVPDNASWQDNQGSTTAIITARGMFQGAETIYPGGYGRLPDRIVVNIEPTVPANDAKNYPLTAPTRERMKQDFKREVTKAVDTHLMQAARNKQRQDYQDAYDAMLPGYDPRNPKVKLSFITNNRGGRYTQQELDNFNGNKRIQTIGNILRDMLQDMEAVLPPGDRVTNTVAHGFDLGDLNEGGINLQNVANTAENKILLSPFSLFELGNNDPRIVAQLFAHAMLHEFNHNYSREEGADFTWKFLRNDSLYGTDKRGRFANAIEQILSDGKGGIAPDLLKLAQDHIAARGRTDTQIDYVARARQGRFVRKSRQRGVSEGDPNSGGPIAAEVTNPIVERFRDRMKSTDDYVGRRFVLPDGQMLEFNQGLIHHEGARGIGVSLEQATNAGIMRYRDGNAEVGAPITIAQAKLLLDAQIGLGNADFGIDVQVPGQRGSISKVFDERATPSAIRKWVNSQFSNEAPTQAGVTPQSVSKTVLDETKRLIKDDTGAMPIPSWNTIKQTTGWGQGKSKPTGYGPKYNALHETIMLPAGATTTLDMSAPGRQGLALIHTPQYWKALLQMPRGLLYSEFDKIDKQLRAKPIFQPVWNPVTQKYEKSVAEKAGLKLMVPASSTQVGPRAQQIASKWLETGGFLGPEYIKGVKNPARAAYFHTIGYPVRASNRAFITFLNSLRANRFEYLMDRAQEMSDKGARTGRTRMPGIMGSVGFSQAVTKQEAANMDPYLNHELAKEIADFVNTATGAAPLKTHILPFRQAELNLERGATILSGIFFSPGLMASRIRMLNPNTYVMASPAVRKEYMKSALATTVAWYAFSHMIKMAAEGLDLEDEVEISDKITSADFGKVRIGDTRLDVGGGFQQFIVNYARVWHGGWTSSANQQFRNFGEGYRAETQRSNIERFLTNKMNPVVKFAYDLADADQYAPFHVYDRMAQLAVPLYVQDIIEITKENPQLFPLAAPIALFGGGTQMYGKGESVGKLVDPENEWLSSGAGGIRSLMPWNIGEDEYEMTDFPWQNPEDQWEGE